MFAIRILLNVVGVMLLMMLASSVYDFEVDEERGDLISLGEGADGSPSLSSTLPLPLFT